MRPTETAIAERTATVPARVLVLELGRTVTEPGELATALGGAGFDVRFTSSVPALEQLACDAPDAVVIRTDRVAPPILDVCRRLRAEPSTSRSALLLVTAERSVEALEAALGAGVDDLLASSAEPSSIEDSLRASLAFRAAEGVVAGWDALRKERERALRRHFATQRWATLLVHDLKAPLNVIDLMAQSLLRHAALADSRREAALQIREQTRRLVDMVMSLLDIGRAREGVLRPQISRVDARKLCDGLLRDFTDLATSRDIGLEALTFTAELHADPELLRRALANLVDNALQHAPPGGTVTLTLSPRPGHTQLRVSDDGPGVPAELREAVFEPFTQASGGVSLHRGLGLTFCKLAVSAHGGRIWLEDEPRGTVVTIVLPDRNAEHGCMPSPAVSAE